MTAIPIVLLMSVNDGAGGRKTFSLSKLNSFSHFNFDFFQKVVICNQIVYWLDNTEHL